MALDITQNTKQNRKKMKKSMTLGASNHSFQHYDKLQKRGNRKAKGDVNTIKRQPEHIRNSTKGTLRIFDGDVKEDA